MFNKKLQNPLVDHCIFNCFVSMVWQAQKCDQILVITSRRSSFNICSIFFFFTSRKYHVKLHRNFMFYFFLILLVSVLCSKRHSTNYNTNQNCLWARKIDFKLPNCKCTVECCRCALNTFYALQKKK